MSKIWALILSVIFVIVPAPEKGGTKNNPEFKLAKIIDCTQNCTMAWTFIKKEN